MISVDSLESAIGKFFTDHKLDLPDIDCEQNRLLSLKACQACENIIREGKLYVSDKDNISKKSTNSLILFVAVNLHRHRWNTTAIVNSAIDVYHILDGIYIIKSYLVQSGPMSLSKQIHDLLQHHLTKHNWQHNALVMALYKWYCLQLKFPTMSDRLNCTLPPALFLLDSHDNSLKISGLEAVNHILNETGKAEMRWQGRANVIYDAVQRLTYLHSTEIAPKAYLTLTIVFKIFKTSTEDKELEYQDEIYRRLLADMLQEDLIKIRQRYAAVLHDYVVYFGPDNLKHLSTITRVVFSYLTYPNELMEITRRSILRTLIYLLEIYPSGMKPYYVPALQATLRCLSDAAETDAAGEVYRSALTVCRLIKAEFPDLINLIQTSFVEFEGGEIFTKLGVDLNILG